MATVGSRAWSRKQSRLAGLIMAALVGLTATVLLALGLLESRGSQVATLLIGCSAISVFVVLLPTRMRIRLGLVATVFVTAAGFLAILLQGSPDHSGQEESTTDAEKVFLLMKQGPFTGPVPKGLVSDGISEASVGAPSTAAMIGALRFDYRYAYEAQHLPKSGDSEEDVTAFVELYRTPARAEARARAGFEEIRSRVGPGVPIQGNAKSYCVWVGATGPGSYVQCGGQQGLVYLESVAYPPSNISQYAASVVMNGIFRYADEKTRLATS